MYKKCRYMALLAVAALDAQGDLFTQRVWQSPQVVAASARHEAARLRVAASGRWADPEVEGMYSERRMPDETNPMWELNLIQPLPRPGERAADRDRAQAVLAITEAEWQASASMVAAEAATALAEWHAAKQRAALLLGQREQTERALSAVQNRLGAGQGRIDEVLALQSRLTSLHLDIEEESFMAAEAERAARQVLGLDPDAALPDFSAPRPESVAVHAAPERSALTAQQDEARAMKAMARAAGRPMTAAGIRFEREETSGGDEDTLGIALMTDLPWNSRRYARADMAAADAELAEKDAALEALERQFEADRARARQRIDLTERTRATVRDNLERLDREYEAWVESTGTTDSMDASSVLMLIDLLERRTMLQMQVIDADLQSQISQAALWRYVPLMRGEKHE